MRKIHFKHKTLVIWSIVLGIISAIAIVFVILGALLKTNVIKASIPPAGFLIPGLIFAPWVIPLFILVSIAAAKKNKQDKNPRLIDNEPSKKDSSTSQSHAIHKMKEDSDKHTKEIKK